MGLGDALSGAISNIYEAINHYDYSAEYKRELVDMLANMEYTLLKIDNSDKQVGDNELSILKTVVEGRVALALSGGDPYSLQVRMVLKDN